MQNKINLDACETDTSDIEYLVCHVGLLWRRLVNAKIKSLNISGTDKRVLCCIARNPGLTQVQIATLLDLEPQNLIRSLDKLEKQGLIQKQPDSHDRRVKCLHTTNEAANMLAKIQALSESIKPYVLNGLDPSQVELIVNYLAKMRENIFKQLGAEEESLEPKS